MNHNHYRRLRLAARNEGKIKSYESCVDVRAWSHDSRTRNCYLRDWIKCDMPICVIPVCTLSSILSIMTCSSRGRVAPRCRSRCQSKFLIDRLCSSCTVMRECLSNNREFEKYFHEEHFETIHWPCEKCLEVLKNIKMFWKIVVDKVLRINVPKTNNMFKCEQVYSVQTVAKEWQKEIIEEALYVKSNTLVNVESYYNKRECEHELGRTREKTNVNNNIRSVQTETDCEFRSIAIQTVGKSVCENINKCTSASIKRVNLDSKSHTNKDNEVIMIYKNNIQNLQHQFNIQKNEVDRLKKENVALNVELQRCRENLPKNLENGDRPLNPINKTFALVSPVFDSKEKTKFNKPKEIDSEMIITLKHCKHENFRHVSVIQVLHKTNELNLSDINSTYFKKEDPVYILNKVHETFDAIVNREISIANKTEQNFQNKSVTIKSMFRNVGESRSVPSCTTSTNSFTSESNFESANETITIRPGY